MSTTLRTQQSITITNDLQRYKDKNSRLSKGLLNLHQLSSNSNSSGSIPKRYQSVYAEGTPLASFGVRNDEKILRSRSPPTHMQSQHHQRPLKPIKEFLTTQSVVSQQDDRQRSFSQTSGYNRSQTDATIQNANVALAKTLNTLRQEPGDPTPTIVQPAIARGLSRPKTNLTTKSNFHYQRPGGTKGPLPVELITKRPMSSMPSTTSDPTKGTNLFPGQQPTSTTTHYETKSMDTSTPRASTPYRLPTKSLDTGLHQTNEFNFESVTVDEYPDKYRRSKYESNPLLSTRPTSTNQLTVPRSASSDNQHRSLPEVSVNPHIQSTLQKNTEQFYEPITNGLSTRQYRSTDLEDNYKSSNDRHLRHRHHHIQVEPTDTFKRTSSPIKHQHVVDVQPNIIVQYQRTTQGTTNPLNDVYIERENTGTHLLPSLNGATNSNNNNNNNNNGNIRMKKKTITSPPSSPTTHELNRIWKKTRRKYSFRSINSSGTLRRGAKGRRPPGRLKNYGDESETETTATETQSQDEDMARRNGLPPSDLGSDAWSDLTSEFSDTKFRKHPNIRTSTPNMTRQSSSQSSKDVGQIRKQLSDLQIMYNDLLKLLDIDIESVRSSVKSSTSSHTEHHNRRHRFRKVMPVTSSRHSNLDMKEVNQRFTRLETSVVTLAESIAKLSAQIQMQRVLKDDVQQLRAEVAELRQQIHHPHSRQPFNTASIPQIGTSQQTTRLISPNIQRLAAINSNNPLNVSTSYMPSTSIVQRTGSLIDPRQARKIEQFFGAEAMLRYFLSLLNYEEYATVLERERIGIYELPYVSERKLQSLGIPYGPCARIIYEAQQYFISLLTLKSTGIDV